MKSFLVALGSVFYFIAAAFVAIVSGDDVVITTKDCGVSKGCFRSSSTCTQATCQYLVTYRTVNDNLIQFEVSGNITVGATPYMTMGIGNSPSMDSIYTIGCHWNGSSAIVLDGLTPPLPDRGHDFLSASDSGLVSGQEASYNRTSKQLSCRFYRNRAPGRNNRTLDLRGNVTYYLFAASGPKTSESGYGNHHKSKWFTAHKVSFQVYSSAVEVESGDGSLPDYNVGQHASKSSQRLLKEAERQSENHQEKTV